ncbi:impB/mucB/samB family protein [Prosthecobacter fluviatilis]|uniref:ImpB/mucB/samB family protein n=1 Tax=Prosthecobacter fluviatilis TaxID=445931 RepID=A0ABW0KIS9_9BACT
MISPDAPSHSQPLVDWLFLDLNSYFASVEQQLNPALRGRPVAVVPVDSDTTCAIAASHEAKKYGIKTGTNIGEARRRCPHLITVMAGHDRYVEFHHDIIKEVERHFPVHQICSIDEMACKLDAPRRPLEVATALAKRIKQGLREHIGECITCSIGLAPNRFLAKVASDMQKPDGLVALLQEDLPGRLLDLELRDLCGIGRRMEPRLHACGIRTMADLWAADRETLHRAWGGVGGDRFWHGLHGGITEDDVPPAHRTIGHSHVLAPEFRTPPAAGIVARRLLLKAASRLRRMEYRASHLHLSIRLEDGPRCEAQARFDEGSDSIALARVLADLWLRVMKQARWQRVKKVSVTLFGLVAEAWPRQLELFDLSGDSAPKQQRELLSRVMDDINQKYGRDSVVIGFTPDAVRTFSGTKIAFTRIPDREEFKE